MNNQAVNIAVIGASSGIGLGFAKHYIAQKETGMLFASYRENKKGLNELCSYQNFEPLKVDVTVEETIAVAAENISQRVDRLHLLIYCAGYLHDQHSGPEKAVKNLSSDQLKHYFEVNAIGAALCGKYFRQLLKHEDQSIFAAISARVGSIGDNRLGGWYGYRASKTALNMFLKTIAIEFARSHPRCAVILLHPGTTDTPLSEPFQKNVAPGKLFSVTQTVGYLSTILEGITHADSGRFLAWDGSDIVW